MSPSLRDNTPELLFLTPWTSECWGFWCFLPLREFSSTFTNGTVSWDWRVLFSFTFSAFSSLEATATFLLLLELSLSGKFLWGLSVFVRLLLFVFSLFGFLASFLVVSTMYNCLSNSKLLSRLSKLFSVRSLFRRLLSKGSSWILPSFVPNPWNTASFLGEMASCFTTLAGDLCSLPPTFLDGFSCSNVRAFCPLKSPSDSSTGRFLCLAAAWKIGGSLNLSALLLFSFSFWTSSSSCTPETQI